VQVPGYTIYNGGATALFDATRSALPAISTFGITLVPGDYDRDGLVTAADYVLWRKNDGSPAAYDIWRAHSIKRPVAARAPLQMPPFRSDDARAADVCRY